MSVTATIDWARSKAERHAVLDRFEDDWERGGRPRLEDYLPTDPALREATFSGLLHIELECRLKAAETVRVEEYLQRFPELAQRPETVLSLLAAEFRLRNRTEAVSPAEYADRFPQWRDTLLGRLTAPTGAAAGSSPATHLSGRFGRYWIERVLGAGSMGNVYLAFDSCLERWVALKVPQERTAGAARFRRRFQDEARAAGQVHHPAVCTIYDAGEIDGISYLTMACIEGQPMNEALALPLSPARAVELVGQVARGIEAAHAQGVTHRDLKPSNIMIDRSGNPVVTDFGVARRHGAMATSSREVIGTPIYMSPEQARGDIESTRPSADVYSLGAILFELLTGRTPFVGSAHEVLEQKLTAHIPPRPSQWCPGLCPRLEAICLCAMATLPHDRFPNMNAFAQALAEWQQQASPVPKPGPPVPVAIDAPAAELVVATLRQWGWEPGLARLKAVAETLDEPRKKAAFKVLLGWLAGERGHYAEAIDLFQTPSWPDLAAWALAGQALAAIRERDLPAAGALLAQANAQGDANDLLLRATLTHLQGVMASHKGMHEEAIALLHTALEQFGAAHFGAGRVLDTLGSVHARRGSFAPAVEFYTHALAIKERFADEAGIALTHGQLGRLYLEWEFLAQADEHFGAGIRMARQIGDERGEAQLTNHRGQVRLAQGKPDEANWFLDECIRSAAGRWKLIEAFGRKDRASAHLASGLEEAAEQDAARADELFREAGFAEGAAHVKHVLGQLRLRQQRPGEAAVLFQTAATMFEQHGQLARAAAALRDFARAQLASGIDAGRAAETFRLGLELAERGGHAPMARALEAEFRQFDELEHLRYVWRRRRGSFDSPFASGSGSEAGTALVAHVRPQRAGEADLLAELPLWRHLLAVLVEVLETRGITALQYQGEEVVAILVGADHASRGVHAALALTEVMRGFNRPRRALGWPLWHVGVGLASGRIWHGELGTHRKRDWTVLGPATELASFARAHALPDVPCAVEATRAAAPHCRWASSPRSAPGRDGGHERVWDVLGGAS